jgi:hypothetical protein
MTKAKEGKNLVQTLRASGLRKRVARTVADASGEARKGRTPSVLKKTVATLKFAAAELESRVDGVLAAIERRARASSRRSAAAKKAANTRERLAAARSASARQGAKTRARERLAAARSASARKGAKTRARNKKT